MLKKIFGVLFLFALLASPALSFAETSDSEIMAKIESLTRQIEELQKQLPGNSGANGFCYDFNNNLKFGDGGGGALHLEEDVRNLQAFLAENGFNVSNDGKGGAFFGELTASGVVGFQEKYASEILSPHNLSRGSGYVGPSTRAVLNRLYGCKGSNRSITPAPAPLPHPDLQKITVDLKVNGSDGPVSIEPGYAMFTWTSTGADYCTATGAPEWSGRDYPSGSARIKVGDGKTVTNYSLTCFANSGIDVAADIVRVTSDAEISETPFVTILSPNGGEEWSASESKDITWDTNISGTADVYLKFESNSTCFVGSVRASAERFSVTPEEERCSNLGGRRIYDGLYTALVTVSGPGEDDDWAGKDGSDDFFEIY